MVVSMVDPQGKIPVAGFKTGEGQAIPALQSRLSATAVRRKDKRFERLFPLLWRQEWLGKALDAVLDNSGSETPGVDGKRGSLLRDPDARIRFIRELSLELKRRRYRASPVLRKYVPKADGAQRPIGIPTIRDRVVQMALKMVIEPIFEADFLCNSNGFRLGRSTLECILPLYRYGDSVLRYDWVIEGDIKGCFDNIDHKVLMEAIRRRIADKRVLRLVWAFLKAPVVERGSRTKKSRKGTPQGGILSPLLANIYLDRFDQYWFEQWGKIPNGSRAYWRRRGKASCVLLRYADDFILPVKGSRKEANGIVNDLRSLFRGQLKLNLSSEKTRVVSMEEGFDFLGFRIQRRRLGHYSCVRICPTHRNVARLTAKLQRMLGTRANADNPVVKIKTLNRVLRGWANYYRKVNSGKQFGFIDYIVDRNIVFWLRRTKRVKTIREGYRRIKVGERTILSHWNVEEEVFRLSSLKSPRTSLEYRTHWKYRHIRNPYLRVNPWKTRADSEKSPMIVVQEVQPTNPRYDNTFQVNRRKAFVRDGWRCTECGRRRRLQAHHLRRVPKGQAFDPAVVHRVENLKTLCTACHNKRPRLGRIRHSV